MAIDRERVLAPYKSKLDAWFDEARNANEETTKKLLTEGYGMFFEIIEPVSDRVGTTAVFHTLDRRLVFFDDKFLPDDPGRGTLRLDDYKFAYHHKNASLVLTGGFDPYTSKRITVYYDTSGSPSGQLRIEETSSAWLRPGKTELHDNETRSLKELQPIQIAGLTLSLARVYAEEVVKK